MELYQLRTFVTVAAEGHITRAAEKLHTSQPSVSAHIKALEEELGLTLFKRTPKGMVLTSAGNQLKTGALGILEGVDDLNIQAKRLRSKLTGAVSIGLNIDPMYLRISMLYGIMKRNFPGVELHMLQKTSWEVQAALRSGELDLGFVYEEANEKEFEVFPLTHFDLLIVGPPDWKHQLEKQDTDQLLRLPWIWTSDRCCFSQTYSRLFHDQDIEPIKAAVSDQESTLKTLAATGAGLTLMIKEEALEAEANGLISVRQEVVDTIKLCLLSRKRQAKDPLVRATAESIRKCWKDEIPEVCE